MKLSLLSLVTLALSATGVYSHGTEVRACVHTNGKLRFWVEHWHGNLASASRAGTMDIRNDVTAVTSRLVGTGVINNVQPTALRGCAATAGGVPDLVGTACTGSSTTTGDWVYYDFPAPACGQRVSYTMLSGQTVYLTEACPQLYPATYAKNSLNCGSATPAPTPGVMGDPHFKTFTGEKYDFHGVCDLVLVHNPAFKNGLGMDIHLRTKQTRMWSYVSSAAVRIADDVLEVMGGTGNNFWLNKVKGQVSADNAMTVAGYSVTFDEVNEKSRSFSIDLGHGQNIEIKTWNGYVSISVNAPTVEDFGGSLGLMGSFDHGSKMSRDNSIVIDDVNAFGQEWQVLAQEPKLFHNIDGPQYPATCTIPSSSEMRRRLGESSITKEDAEIACGRLSDTDNFDLCVFDVMATNDKDSAGAY